MSAIKTFINMYDFSKVKWMNVTAISSVHVATIIALYKFMFCLKWQTYFWVAIMAGIGGVGVTGGAHRLWTHRSFKAKLPLRIILMICYAVAGQNKLYDWVRDHRVHHKYSETDADPHNANRGFFFSHVGWLMVKKHPEVIKRGKAINMDDIIADPVVRFHDNNKALLMIIFWGLIPVCGPRYLWGEEWKFALLSNLAVRYAMSLNFTWLVNSAAHIWGSKPYNKDIMPAENPIVSLFALGEGWHNYHHSFPWDYRAAELGGCGDYSLNLTTLVIDLFAKIGWAYDLKVPSPELIRKVAERRGDGSYNRTIYAKDYEKCYKTSILGTPIEVWDTEQELQTETSANKENIKQKDEIKEQNKSE